MVFNQVLTSSCFLPEGRTSDVSALTPRTCLMMSSLWLTYAMPWHWTGMPKTATSTGQMSLLTPSTEHCGMGRSRRSVAITGVRTRSFLLYPGPARTKNCTKARPILPSRGYNLKVQHLTTFNRKKKKRSLFLYLHTLMRELDMFVY